MSTLEIVLAVAGICLAVMAFSTYGYFWRGQTLWLPWRRFNELEWGVSLSFPRAVCRRRLLLALNLGRAEFQLALEVW